MDSLGEAATPGARAAVIAGFGHRTWFAMQSDRQFELARPAGGLRADPEKAFTTDVSKLKDYLRSDTINTVVFDIEDEHGRVRCVFDIEFQRVDRYRIYQTGTVHPGPTKSKKIDAPVARPKPQPIVVPAINDAAQRLATAEQAFARSKAVHAAAVTKYGELASSARESDDKAARLTTQLGKRLATEVMAGNDLADDHPETDRIKRLELKRDATNFALPLAAEAVDAAAALIQTTGAARVRAALDWAAAEQAVALSDAKALLTAMAPALVRLAAIDRVKTRLIGAAPKTTDPTHPGLISTERVSGALVKQVPTLLRPPELEPEHLAAAISADVEIINQTLETNS